MLAGIEQRFSEEYGIEISLMDERAMSQTRSPFRTVGSLGDYIAQLLDAGA
jgi:acyl carrier protein